MDTLIALKEAMDTAQAELDTANITLSTLRGQQRTIVTEIATYQKQLADERATLNPGMSQAQKDAAEASLIASRNNCDAKVAEQATNEINIQTATEDRIAKAQALNDAKAAYEAQLESL